DVEGEVEGEVAGTVERGGAVAAAEVGVARRAAVVGGAVTTGTVAATDAGTVGSVSGAAIGVVATIAGAAAGAALAGGGAATAVVGTAPSAEIRSPPPWLRVATP